MSEPDKISLAIAENGIREASIPLLDGGLSDGHGSYDKGFPAINFQPKAAGGIPPFGSDMNGFLHSISDLSKHYSSGGVFDYDATHQAAIGGYPIGAIIRAGNGMGYWMATIDNNLTNPNSGGIGWARVSPDRFATTFGSSAAYLATFSPPITEYYDGLEITIKTINTGTNTATYPTLNCNNLGQRGIVREGSLLSLGDMPKYATLIFESAANRWILKNPVSSNAVAPPASFNAGGVGSLVIMPTSTHFPEVPAVWCGGAVISRTTYAALFSAIGTTFGNGNGSTTFGLPDLRGYFIRGANGVSGASAAGTKQSGTNFVTSSLDTTAAGSGWEVPFVDNGFTENTGTNNGSLLVVNPNNSLNPSTFLNSIAISTGIRNVKTMRSINMSVEFWIVYE